MNIAIRYKSSGIVEDAAAPGGQETLLSYLDLRLAREIIRNREKSELFT